MKDMHRDKSKAGEIKNKSDLSIKLVAALQWLVFIMMNTIVPPVIVGNAYGLGAEQIVGLVQRTIFLVGFASLLQILWGHKLPLMEGAAGLWWSIFVIMAQNAVALGQNPQLLLPKLEGGLIIAGILLILLGITPVFHFFEKLFTPLVTGVYLILFSIQMSIILFSGMLGLTDKGTVDWKFMVVSIITVTITFYLSFKGKGLVKSFSPLAGIICGWVLYTLLGTSGGQIACQQQVMCFHCPGLFPGVCLNLIQVLY